MDTERELGEQAYQADVSGGIRKPELEMDTIRFLEDLENKVYRIRQEVIVTIPDSEDKDRILRLLELIETEAWMQERARKQELDVMLDEQYERSAESARSVA